MSDFWFTEIQSGISLFYTPTCASTGPLAKECLNLYPKNLPFAVYTFHQTHGKGQGNHIWETEPGKNLALTLILEMESPAKAVSFNKAITLAVRKAIENLTDTEVLIKWPNDIYVDNLKLSGLLLETFTSKTNQHILSAGVGINVNQQFWDRSYNASSLFNVTGDTMNIINVLDEVMENISFYINNIDNLEIDKEYNQMLWKKDQTIVLMKENGEELKGKLISVDAEGRIVMETLSGLESYHHGVVRMKK